MIAALAVIVATVIELSLRAWVFGLLWGWFLAPAFSLPVPRASVLLGITFIASLLVDQQEPEDSKEFWEKLCYRFCYALVRYALLIVTAWTVKELLP